MSRNMDQLNRILDMLARNKLDEAEKQIESVKLDGGYEAGYLKGLKGILQSIRKPVEEGLTGASTEALEAHLKSIADSVETHYLKPEEEGFFTAWMDFLRKLSRRK